MRKTIVIFFVTALFGVMIFAQCAGENNKQVKTEKKGHRMKVMHLTKTDFLSKVADYEKNPNEWKYLGDKPALIDFYTDWCGPCKMIAPILDELAEEYGEQIHIYKINTDKEQELAGTFGIRSIPSLLFIPMDGRPQMAHGAMSKADLKKAIEEVLIKKES
jgi:thioredoxin